MGTKNYFKILFGFLFTILIMGSVFAASIDDFTNTGFTDTTASFSWTAATGATSVAIQHSINQNNWSDTIVAVDAISGTVENLDQGVLYYFRLNVYGGPNDGMSNVISLTPAPDLTAYNTALAAVTEDDYTIVTWEAYELILAANVVTDQNTQAEVDTATSNITTAQGDLVEIADLTNYTAALAAVTEADYTTVTWEAYELILAANVVTDQNTQAEVDTATSNITTAQGDLVEIANLTNYTAALAAVIEAEYTTDSWTAYMLIVNENVVTDQNTQAEVDTATTNITTAQEELVNFADDLFAAKTTAAELIESNYTTATWTILENTLDMNEETTDEIIAKTEAILDAIDGLVMNEKVFTLFTGWNLISVSKFVDSAEMIGGDYNTIYTFVDGAYLTATLDDLTPLNAIFIKVDSERYVGVMYDEVAIPTLTERSLVEGWNVISVPNSMHEEVINVALAQLIEGNNEGLTTVYAWNNGLATIQNNWTLDKVNAESGYWVHMNEDKIFSLPVNPIVD